MYLLAANQKESDYSWINPKKVISSDVVIDTGRDKDIDGDDGEIESISILQHDNGVPSSTDHPELGLSNTARYSMHQLYQALPSSPTKLKYYNPILNDDTDSYQENISTKKVLNPKTRPTSAPTVRKTNALRPSQPSPSNDYHILPVNVDAETAKLGLGVGSIFNIRDTNVAMHPTRYLSI
jgi:hypothetical protein